MSIPKSTLAWTSAVAAAYAFGKFGWDAWMLSAITGLF